MGFDVTYQGVYSDMPEIERAKVDPEYAERIFYPFIAFQCLNGDVSSGEDTEFIESSSEIKSWTYDPGSRMQQALIYIMDPHSYETSESYEALETTFPYRFVMGEEIFPNLTAGQGMPVRVSSPKFIKQCSLFAKTLSLENLRSNFDVTKMSDMGIYKIQSSSEYHSVINYYSGLCEFYEIMEAKGNTSVFIIED